jgi:hypothetical protein
MKQAGLACALVTVLLSPGLKGQNPPSGSSNQLHIVIVEGDGPINNVRQRVTRAPVIEVRDRNNVPVAGALVSFRLEQTSGAGGSFSHGASFLNTVTDANGRAVAKGFRPNNVPGTFHINATASFQGQTAAATMTQTNALLEASAAAGAGGSGSAGAAGTAGGASGAATGASTAVVVGVAAGGVAAAATAIAVKEATNSSPESSSPPTATIGAPGSPVFGAPTSAPGAKAEVLRPSPSPAAGPRVLRSSESSATLAGELAAGAAVGAAWYLEHRAKHRIALTPSDIRFGKVEAGEPANAVFLVTNRSAAPLVITSIAEPELFHITPARALPLTLNPGDTAVFRVTFRSAAAGNFRDRVQFAVSGPHGWSRILTGYAQASAVAALRPEGGKQ